MGDYERGQRDVLRVLLKWATEHHNTAAIYKIRKVAAVWGIPLGDVDDDA